MAVLENRMSTLSDPASLHCYDTSSFVGGNTMTATAHIRVPETSTAPSNSPQPDHVPSEKCTLALDSHSDVTIAESRFVHRTKTIDKEVATGGGTASITREGPVDIIANDGPIATVPALAATQP